MQFFFTVEPSRRNADTPGRLLERAGIGTRFERFLDRRRISAENKVPISSQSRRYQEERIPTYAPRAYRHLAMTRLMDRGFACLQDRARMVTSNFCFIVCSDVESLGFFGGKSCS